MSHPSVPWRGRGLSSRALRAAGLGIALSLFVPSSADAAPSSSPSPSSVRYGRTPGAVKTRGKLETRVKKAKEAAEIESRAPTVDGTSYRTRQPSVTLAVIDDQIGVAKRLVGTADRASKDFPGYVHRLAGLYLDKHAILDLQAGSLYEKIDDMEKSRQPAKAKTLRAKQTRLNKLARAADEEAGKVMAALVGDERYIGYDRRDEVLLDLALTQSRLGKEEAMRKTYARLIKDHPQSQYRPNVYVAFADHEFDRGRVGDAKRLYQQIIDGYDDSPLYAYALYKSAWCDLNPADGASPDYEHALSRFVQAIDATKAGKAGSEANAKQLRREARRDLVRAYVHAGKPSRAWEFFGKVGTGPGKGEDMQRTQMELLAAAYFGEGKYVESTATYRKLQDEFAGDAELCAWQGKILVNALATDDAEIQWKEAERLADTWRSFRDGKFSKKVRRQCRTSTADTLAQLGTTWHDEATKTKRSEPWRLAAQAYAQYLDLFPKAKDAYELAFYLAEVHWARAEQLYGEKDAATKKQGLEQFEQAHDAFVRVLEMKPDGRLTKEAAYAQMLALKNAMEYDETAGPTQACRVQSDGTCPRQAVRGRRGTTQSDDYPRKEYDEASRRMLDAYARYEKYVSDPKDPQLPKILHHRVKLMIDHNRFDEAKPLLKQVTEDFEGSIYAVWSAEMMLDVLTIAWQEPGLSREDKAAAGAELERFANRLEKSKTYRHDEAKRVRAQVPRLMAAVGWTKAEDKRLAAKAGDDPDGYVECGQIYVDLYERYPDHDRPADLLFNAARCFEAGYRVGAAIKVRRVLLDEFPDSDQYQQTLRETAENYQAIAYYEQSAELLETYADKYGGDDYAETALHNAFLFRRGLGDEEAAKKDLSEYESMFRRKDPKRAAEIFWSEGELLDDAAARLQHAQQYIDKYGKKGGTVGLAVAHATVGQILWDRSCPERGADGVCVSLKRRKSGAGQATQDAAEELRNRGKARRRCGVATRGVVTVHARDRKLADKAQEHLAKAAALFDKVSKMPADPEEERAARDAWGMALVLQADAEYEDYLRIEMPENLSFHVETWKKDSGVGKWEREYAQQVARAEDSRKRFKVFLEGKVTKGTSLGNRYDAVAKTKSPHWALAAMSRTAVVNQNFADQLYRAEIPRELQTDEQRDMYCDALADYAAPFEQTAHASFSKCLSRSTEYSYFNEFSRSCEEEMQQRMPEEFPATNELFGRSRYTDSAIRRVEVQVSLLGDDG